jgi:trypsin
MPWLLNEPLNSDAPWVKVVGGVNAVSGDAPYQIAMLRAGSFTCGGSLIAPNKVLTAAHCVFGYENQPTTFTVRYNTLDRTTGPTITVQKVNRHAQYSSSTIDYDVATFILSAAFTPGTNAAVVPLSGVEPDQTANLKLTGWGRLSGGGVLPTLLQKSEGLKVVPTAQCQSAWGAVNAITPRMLCAHSTTQSACNGDSGGPLVVNGQQVGVVSWGSSSCLHATYPNVYVNVANTLAWINAAN